ncbi:hypothetical protein O181_041522 [Austropuccinia psidii MF-1]|uniref:Uncharacterized protein n=1 Tax=Austropuccinia psidii MF-1 TaxID=1389203 RepID=A0A9Q3HEX7_9BASI|nr:hypothetical protein [Austropuccinia psidii MF-1]
MNIPNKQFIKRDRKKEPAKPKSTNEQRKFHKFGGIGKLANTFLQEAKINEVVETEDHNDKEEEPHSEKENEETKTSEIDQINIINSQIHNIDSIYEVLDVNSNLLQVGTYDTCLTNIQYAKMHRTKPDKGWVIQLGNIS